MSEQTPEALPIGATFHGRYEVLRCLRAGGMGAVYEVLHLETRRRRALKVMLPSLVADPDLRARFEQEATITADIDSEHIVETFDAGVDGPSGAPFLVMELLKGEELDAVLAARGRLPPDEVVTLLHQAALALDKTHAAGIVHRDLKPENLFVTRRDDGTPRLKILDFGIAKVVATSTQGAKTTRSMGTPLFMSPEQVTGDGSIGPRADLYALGQIAYALLVGEAYWQKETEGTEGIYPLLFRVAKGATEPASVRATRLGVALPPSFDAWFARATAASPADRYGRASELVTALAAALGTARPPLTSLVEPAEAPTRDRDAIADNPTIAALSVPGQVPPGDPRGTVGAPPPNRRPGPTGANPGSPARTPDAVPAISAAAVTLGEIPDPPGQPEGRAREAPRISSGPPPARRARPVLAIAAVLVLSAGAALAALRGSAPGASPDILRSGGALPPSASPTMGDPERVPPNPPIAAVPPSVTPARDAPTASAAAVITMGDPVPQTPPIKAPPPVRTARPVLVPKVPKESRDPTLVR